LSVERLARVEPRSAEVGSVRHTRRLVTTAALLVDLIACCAAYLFALLLHDHLGFLGVTSALMRVDWSMLVYVGLTIATLALCGLYQPEAAISGSLMVRLLARATAVAFVIMVVAIFLAKAAFVQQSRVVLAVYFVCMFLTAAVLRVGVLVARRRSWVRRARPVTLTVGPSPLMQVLAKRLDGLAVFIEDPVRLQAGESTPQDVQGLAAAIDASRRRGSRCVVVFLDGEGLPPQTTLALADAALEQGADVYVCGDLLREMRRTALLFKLFEAPVVHLSHPARAGNRFLKRAFDLAGALGVLVLLSPVFLVAALAIKLTSRGPVLFVQDRIGQNGRVFHFYKFRSMSVADDRERHESVHRDYVKALIQGENGSCNFGDARRPVYKLQDDHRVTAVGKWLRRSSLDELPQLWNVVKGDMSLVGPRPALAYEVVEYKEWHRRRLLSKPGVTGLWQIAGRSRATFDEMVFQDAMYSYGWCLMTDLSFCLRTVPAALAGRGAA
jgi:exopolysaccharide biosynthesis polyprenyl glycosylphosphotransferase